MPSKIQMECEECGEILGYVVEIDGYADYAFQHWFCLKHGEKK